ncbi:zinc carboxypeptidase, partial [Candidatus Fermentibacteria bacterium]|nr:zinc carboxypeptidase [Candidatus Fermentibacteria bacterium]
MMKTIPRHAFLLLLLPVFLGSGASAAVTATPLPDPVKQVRIEFRDKAEWERFRRLGGSDFLELQPGVCARLALDDRQIQKLRSHGFGLDVEIEDLQAYYASRMSGQGGNFGLFHTYSETEGFLDSLHVACPQITTPKQSIGLTHEGRDIWAMKISDNPGIDEDEPEVLFDALHHAVEVPSVEVVLCYMRWLCEGYGRDPHATYLVDHREIWFVPIVNPDGLVYLETVSPEGGAWWRKNRRDNGDGTWGVDLNRNYPYHWGGTGAPSDPSSDYYRGPWAGSEPEVQAMMSLMIGRDFVSHISFHSSARAIYLPWGYTAEPTGYHSTLLDWCRGMTKYNCYDYGQLPWRSSGTSKDWAIGECQTKGVVLSCTHELAGLSWHEEDIAPVCTDALWPQIYTTWVAGSYCPIEEAIVQGGDGNARLDPGETAGLVLDIKNRGLFAPAPEVSVAIRSDDPYVCILDAEAQLGTIAAQWTQRTTDDPFLVRIDPFTPEDHVATLFAELRFGDACVEDTLQWVVGPAFVRFEDDMEDNFGVW